MFRYGASHYLYTSSGAPPGCRSPARKDIVIVQEGSGRLVTLVNPNFVKPGVAPYALDILCSHLEAAGFDVEVLDLTFRESGWRLGEYFAAAILCSLG